MNACLHLLWAPIAPWNELCRFSFTDWTLQYFDSATEINENNWIHIWTEKWERDFSTCVRTDWAHCCSLCWALCCSVNAIPTHTHKHILCKTSQLHRILLARVICIFFLLECVRLSRKMIQKKSYTYLRLYTVPLLAAVVWMLAYIFSLLPILNQLEKVHCVSPTPHKHIYYLFSPFIHLSRFSIVCCMLLLGVCTVYAKRSTQSIGRGSLINDFEPFNIKLQSFNIHFDWCSSHFR